MHKKILEFIDCSLSSRNKEQRRFLQSIDNSKVIDFTSNDYLGLANHPFIKKRAIEYINNFGVGSKASRLLTGTLQCCTLLEDKIANFKGTESALILNSGYQANVSILGCLANKYAVIFIDRLCHHSILMGAVLSGAKCIRYRHNDYCHLEQLLYKYSNINHKIIVTESVFSMDGDCANLDILEMLSHDFGALLYVDEAHATGVLGFEGRGLTYNREGIDVVIGTFGKAFGSFGAYVACSHKIKDYLVNFCGGLIYSTALPPPVLGSIDAAMDIIPIMGEERKRLFDNAEMLRDRFSVLGINFGFSTTHIIPLYIGDDKRTLEFSNDLKSKGIFLFAIRYPTVPRNQSRLRIALSSEHTQEHIDTLFSFLEDLCN